MKLKELFEKQQTKTLTRPYIIAEAGVNHEGEMSIAYRLIDEAKEGGADAIKFQSYKAETLAMRESPAYWDTTKEPTLSQFDLFKKHDGFWKKEFEELKKHCDKVGIEFLSTPFDIESAVFLNELMDVYKVSSSDITNKPFIEFMCDFRKPVLLSTGASNLDEVENAVNWIKSKGNALALMHCVLNYPTEERNANLGRIIGLRKAFPDLMIGYSDHTMPADMKALEIAMFMGAVILEKHFTHDKSLPGNDHYHAMDKEDLKNFIKLVERDLILYGREDVKSFDSETPARANARRSLVAARFIPKGKIIEAGDLTWKRPASGISPADIDKVLGRITVEDIKEDSSLKFEMFN